MCACSWRVPFTAGVGPLSIVAPQDLGELGASKTAPVVVDWRWHHHVPSLGAWSVLVALLLFVPANRCAPAWLILLPVFAVQLGWSMLARLLSLPIEATEHFGTVLGALAGAWAAVWLMAPWLARRRVPVGLASALVLMWGVGGVSGFNAYGVGFMDQARVAIMAFLIGSVLLLSSTVLAAVSYRRWFPPERFLAWSLLWTFGMTMLLATLLFGGPVMGAGLALGGGVLDRAFMLFASLVAAGLTGAMIYLVNLPFLVLAGKSPWFRARFHDALRLVSVPRDTVAGARSAGDGTGFMFSGDVPGG